MATNAMVIEFGIDRPMGSSEMETFKNVLGTLETWKRENVIEGFQYYAVVTGNRSQRAGLLLVETSHEQLENLVVNPAWATFNDLFLGTCCNLTINRAITLQRAMELMANAQK